MVASTKDFKTFADGTRGASMSTGEDGKWKKNTTGTKVPTPKVNAKKIESNAKKIEKLMGMLKGKGKGSVSGPGGRGSNLMGIVKGPGKNIDLPK